MLLQISVAPADLHNTPLRPCWFIAGQTVQALRAACVRRADFASDLARNELAGLRLRHAGDRRCLPVRVQPRITRQENELARMGHDGLVRPEGVRLNFSSAFRAAIRHPQRRPDFSLRGNRDRNVNRLTFVNRHSRGQVVQTESALTIKNQ